MGAPRIVPIYDPRGMVTLTVVVGIGAGVVKAAIEAGLGNPANVHWALALGVFLAPILIFCVAFAGLTQRKRAALLTSAAFAFTYTMAMEATASILSPFDRGVSLLLPAVVPQNLIFPTAVCLLAGGLALALRWLNRRLLVVLIEQDGSYCWRCAYELGAQGLERCPECGTAVDRARFRAQAFHRGVRHAGRHSKSVALLFAVLVGLAAGWTMHASATRAALRFASRFTPGDMPLAGWVLDPRAPRGTGSIPCPAAWLDLGGEAGMGLTISYLPGERAGIPAMRVELTSKTQQGHDTYILPVTPNVSCDLNRAQAEYLIEHGVPSTLLDAFRSARSSMVLRNAGDPIRALQIPAASHFPALPNP